MFIFEEEYLAKQAKNEQGERLLQDPDPRIIGEG